MSTSPGGGQPHPGQAFMAGVTPQGPAGPHAAFAPDPDPRDRPRSRFFLWFPLGLSAAALVLAAVALVVALLGARDPLGAGMERYDYTTPRAALLSDLDMEINQDLRARLDLERLADRRKVKEQRKTLQIRKEADWGDQKILFITYERNGVKQFDTVAFEKDAKSGLWLRTNADSFKVEQSNRQLAQEMREWRASGGRAGGQPRLVPKGFGGETRVESTRKTG